MAKAGRWPPALEISIVENEGGPQVTLNPLKLCEMILIVVIPIKNSLAYRSLTSLYDLLIKRFVVNHIIVYDHTRIDNILDGTCLGL